MPGTIQTVLGECTITDRKGRVVRRESYIRSRHLLASLHTIRDSTVETHTRNNLQILIDQIVRTDPSL